LPSPVKPKTQPTNLNDKRRIIEQKIQESNAKGQKPGLNAIPQGFLPSRESLATQVNRFVNSKSIRFCFSSEY